MFKLKKGRYLIGDPCYSIRGDLWDRVLDSTNCFRSNKAFKIPDANNIEHKIAVFETGGDGGHLGSDGFEYGVDSGTIAAIPNDFVTEGDYIGVLLMGLRLCNIVLFKKDFNCGTIGDTHIYFGDLTIKKIWY